ncbi:hypothetical protein C484_10981 [Natrialba taiwanensis DSM 12281]|uniref:Uncharacterized protein n=1 Tax=Natrialba taiwanensis DSM 12281 TaxID=1230458 RepID=L9ZYR8_9EURY|nr:hypothetical protein C484_10981 [Natrialba taiwanensis DSM 12281]
MVATAVSDGERAVFELSAAVTVDPGTRPADGHPDGTAGRPTLASNRVCREFIGRKIPPRFLNFFYGRRSDRGAAAATDSTV